MKVVFNSVEEFLEELRRDPPFSRIVRLTTSWYSTDGPYRMVSVVSTFANAGNEVVELVALCGEDWGPEFKASEATKDRAREIHLKVEDFCKEHSLEVRAGRLEG